MLDMESIEQNIKSVIAYSQNLDCSLDGVHALVNQWYKAKQKFRLSMDENLIVEFPDLVTFSLDEEEKAKELKKFVDRVGDYYDNSGLAEFIKCEHKGFYDNMVVVPYEDVYSGKTIPVGTKLLKAFKYFEVDNDILHKLQDEASMVIQNNKLTGKLCVSIHPLDFLSSSETTYKWRSCHSLDGDYRAGNLDYMCDETTVMCYIRGEHYTKLPNFPNDVPWNSKKWRMYLHFNDDKSLVMAGRQYPFMSTTALDIIREKVLPMFMNKEYSDWHNDIIYPKMIAYNSGKKSDTSDRWYWDIPDTRYFIPYRMPIKDADLIILDENNALHYDDLLYSHIYTAPYYLWNMEYYGNRHRQRIHMGAKRPKCLCCGENKIAHPATMLCGSCEESWAGFTTCDCCGRRINDDEDAYLLMDGSYVCENCREDYVVECRDCGRLLYRDDAFRIKETGDFICRECMEE